MLAVVRVSSMSIRICRLRVAFFQVVSKLHVSLPSDHRRLQPQGGDAKLNSRPRARVSDRHRPQPTASRWDIFDRQKGDIHNRHRQELVTVVTLANRIRQELHARKG